MSEALSPKAHLVAIIREAREFHKVLREAPRHRSVLQLLRDAYPPWEKLRGHYHAVARWLDADFWAEVGGEEAAKAVPAPVAKALRTLMECREEILPLYNQFILGCCPGLSVSPPLHVDPRLVCWEENSVTWYGMGPKDSPDLWDETHCLAEGQGGRKLRKLSKAIDALQMAVREYMPVVAQARKDVLKRPQPSGDTGVAGPIIWHHGTQSYSVDGGVPVMVSREEANILSAFLKAGAALDTRALERHVSNVARVLSQLKDKFPGAVRFPHRKGEGYYICVRPAPRG